MSTMSVSRPDASTSMYKYFASLISNYVDTPVNASQPDAEIPIESIFKLLEMYRFNAFKDETRSGALALRAAGALTKISKSPAWHNHILDALHQAKQNTFGAQLSTEDAVLELEGVLKKLAKKEVLNDAQKNHARSFFNNFGDALA